MTIEELSRSLEAEGIVSIPVTEWEKLAHEFEELERHGTFVAGDLLIVRGIMGLAAVEEPSVGERVLRRFADAEEVRSFVQQRLDQYERMWDGCGCKVDYYS
ncbi:MAG: hypothetical protein AMS21_09800 [Gemmatimonas sp. SG8_38_2]|nr:MAG: hypothetical protein AMS21_09800 [Gemmatimonas sp. SG8_38_2]